MAHTQQRSTFAQAFSGEARQPEFKFTAPLRPFRQQHQRSRSPGKQQRRGQNVGQGERMISAAAGAILALQGLARRDLTGVALATVGGGLLYRAATGHCGMYQRLGLSSTEQGGSTLAKDEAAGDVHIVESYLINKSPEELYSFWRNFENFPQFMSHLESVQKTDETRSHWVAKAPKLYGGSVEWDAEITADEPNSRIAWRATPDSDVVHQGSVRFQRALGDRGTMVRVELDYHPPVGQVGRWIAKIFGEEPEMQIREDLRKLKRQLEIGEVPTTEGQSRGTCTGVSRREGAGKP